ncbi:MAG: DUF2642 domain-containing protein [Bacillota bacterium]|uniref:DUF2642 domain-containing protein n=1 Tax=Virgibacillus salarius TaxID=447199 RepID=A0A941DWS7_9BACI|nr:MULTISPECIES: DUF2642 domain-containing protein [Bacillaceae]NAZ09830.1 DUF2642 domain-containing protein [Agaribacter marinus]MBR7797121.1 DUF2642 domain-containing protein [Virgibacillus salarius]MCC2252338.1 DUF2642 domain-containing protein [Virgibacillus sp. AGTR]MDY7044882.1 DUF2642 domain-containing protein [Virgibacillus sp. M23]QRZ18906.1 DUF2642 domain-containing protein [Virgibacillus sp. AGTR]
MKADYFYQKACKYYGKPVKVVDHYGKCYRGVLKDVTPKGIYLDSGVSGFFFPFFAIVSLVLLTSLFFI